MEKSHHPVEKQYASEESSCICFFDERGFVAYANDQFREKFEISPLGELEIDKNSYFKINEKIRMLDAVMECLKTTGSTTKVSMKSGRNRSSTYNWEFHTVADRFGKVIGVHCRGYLLSTEQERESELLFRSGLLQNISDAVVYMDLHRRIRIMNSSAETIFGLPFLAAKGKVIDLIFRLQPQKNITLEHLEAEILEQGKWEGTISLIKNKSEKLLLSTRISLIKNTLGLPVGFLAICHDITESTHESDEANLEKIIAHNKGKGVIVTDVTGRVTCFNQMAESIYGVSAKDVMGKPYSPALPLDAKNSAAPDTMEILEKAGHWEGKVQVKKKNGEDLIVLARVDRLNDKEGHMMADISMITDITEKVRIQEEMETLALIARNTNSIVIITDEHSRIKWVNNTFFRQTGYVLEEVQGRITFDLFAGPNTSQDVINRSKEKLLRHEPMDLENILYMKDGSTRWYKFEGRPVYHEDGRFKYYFRLITDIQKLKEQEKSLAESQKRLEDIFNTRFEAIILLSKEGRILQMNDRAEELSFSKRQDRIGKYMWEGPQSLRQTAVSQFLRRTIHAAASGIEINEELQLKSPDGKLDLIHHFCFRPVFNESGQTQYIQAEIADMSEKMHAIRKYNYSEQLLQAYMQNSPVPVWITDLNGHIESLNEKFSEFLGLTENPSGRKIADVFDNTYLDQYRQHTEVVLKTGKPFQAMEYVLDKEKVVHTFIITRFPIYDNGQLSKIGGVGMDITSVLEAQEEKNHSILKFEAVSKATDDLIWEWDILKDRIIWSGENNLHWEQSMHSSDSMIHFMEYLHKDDRDMVQSSLTKAVMNTSKTRWHSEYRMKGPRGEDIHILDRAIIFRDIDGHAIRVIGVMQDITKRILLEKKLIRQQIEEHRKMTRMIFETQESERSRMATDLHDNVNPLLAAARLHINAAEATTEDPAPFLLQSKALLHESIEEIRKISHNLSNTLINEFNLEELVQTTIRKMNPDENILIETDFRNLEQVKPDNFIKMNIIRILQEQIHNTFKYANAKIIHIKLSYKDSYLHLTIEDDGIGFDPKTTRTGIGLANIRNRVESYEGKMKLTSAPGKGCKLEIIMPAITHKLL
jgi:PAS domain S-box-containing protein